MIVKDAIWFTPSTGECIGLIMGEDEITKEKKAYIGIGDGHDEHMDCKLIQSRGQKVSVATFEHIFNYMKS